MKNILLKNLMVILMVFLSIVDAFCGDSATYTVSCTIPAIPGVNAPMAGEKSARPPVNLAQQPYIEPQDKSQKQTPFIIHEETQEKESTAEDQNAMVLVKTIYGR